MMNNSTVPFESDLRNMHSHGNFESVAIATLENYGPSLIKFMAKIVGSPQEANEAYSVFCEDFWKGLPKFSWKASMRTWCYTLARHAAVRQAKGAYGIRAKQINVSMSNPVFQIAEQVRSSTFNYLRTESKNAFQKLREELSEEEQTLLQLRVSQKMAWKDIAAILAADPEDTASLKSETQRLRKRFQLLKDKLKKQAAEQGVLR